MNLNLYYKKLLLFLLKGYVWSHVRIKESIEINIKNLFQNKSYKGFRHSRSLPVHGQRTHTNARTQRSKKLIDTWKLSLEF